MPWLVHWYLVNLSIYCFKDKEVVDIEIWLELFTLEYKNFKINFLHKIKICVTINFVKQKKFKSILSMSSECVSPIE